MAKQKYHLNHTAKIALENGIKVPIEWPNGDEVAENEQPTVEQMFIRQAVKYLTPKQRAIWEYWNYDRLTQDEIAEKLNMKQQNVSNSIKAIEKRIAKWCKSNEASYRLLKNEFGKEKP